MGHRVILDRAAVLSDLLEERKVPLSIHACQENSDGNLVLANDLERGWVGVHTVIDSDEEDPVLGLDVKIPRKAVLGLERICCRPFHHRSTRQRESLGTGRFDLR